MVQVALAVQVSVVVQVALAVQVAQVLQVMYIGVRNKNTSMTDKELQWH